MQPNYNQVPPQYQASARYQVPPNFVVPPAPKNRVSPWTIVMGIMVAILLIVLVQHSVGDVNTVFFKCNTAAVSIQTTCFDQDLGGLLSNALVTVPLFVISLFMFVFYYRRENHDPLKITSSIFFGSMLFNAVITMFEFIGFIYTKSPQIGFYVTLLAFILALGLGIFKIQVVKNKKIERSYEADSSAPATTAG